MKTALKWCFLIVSIAFIVIGVMVGDVKTVFTKAVAICSECIGIG